jgi:hypothetical protein
MTNLRYARPGSEVAATMLENERNDDSNIMARNAFSFFINYY